MNIGTPFKKSYDAYVKSDKYKDGSNPETLNAPASQRQFLENRLYWAFSAGFEAARDGQKDD